MSAHNPSIIAFGAFKGKPASGYLPSFVPAGARVLRRWRTMLAGVPRSQLSGALLFGGAALFFVFSLSVFLFSTPLHSAAAEGSVVSAPVASMPAISSNTSLIPLEMHIANDGLILLRGAQVVAVSGSTITVSTAWGSTDFKWIVLTNGSTYGAHIFGTRFFNRDGQASSLQDIHTGNFVTVTGMLDLTAQEPTLDADSVRNLVK